MSAIYYTDKHLGNFINNLKETSLWHNSIVILLADHGVRYLDTSAHYMPQKYHIPMLWLGGALQIKGIRINKFSSQVDLPVTILNQLGLETDNYTFGQEIFSSHPGYAFYTFNDGVVFIAENFLEIWSNTTNRYLTVYRNNQGFPPDISKIFLQYLSEDFKNKIR